MVDSAMEYPSWLWRLQNFSERTKLKRLDNLSPCVRYKRKLGPKPREKYSGTEPGWQSPLWSLAPARPLCERHAQAPCVPVGRQSP